MQGVRAEREYDKQVPLLEHMLGAVTLTWMTLVLPGFNPGRILFLFIAAAR